MGKVTTVSSAREVPFPKKNDPAKERDMIHNIVILGRAIGLGQILISADLREPSHCNRREAAQCWICNSGVDAVCAERGGAVVGDDLTVVEIPAETQIVN